jgi:hypothetical protein
LAGFLRRQQERQKECSFNCQTKLISGTLGDISQRYSLILAQYRTRTAIGIDGDIGEEIVYFVALHAPITGGADGLQGLPRGRQLALVELENAWTMYYLALVVYIAAMVLLYPIVHSPMARSSTRSRGIEQCAISLGYRIAQYKMPAFVLSAALSGLADALNTLPLHFFAVTDVD